MQDVRNKAQIVRKSIQPQEEIVLNITKQITGGELGKVLQGVEAFTKCFNQEDGYIVNIKVEKKIQISAQEASGTI